MTSNGPWFHSYGFTLNSSQAYVWLKAGERGNYPAPATDVRRMIAHEEYLQACAQVCSSYSYKVGWTDIYWVEEKPQWIHVGQRPEHENTNTANHWMMSEPAYGLWYSAVAFLAAYPSQVKLAVNDMSLPMGGLFDIDATWEPSHHEHNRGRAADVRAITGAYAIPSNQAEEFADLCRTYGATSPYTQVEWTRNHIHCQWP